MEPDASRIPPSEELTSSPEPIDARLEDFKELEIIGSGGNADVTKQSYQGQGPDVVALKQPRMQETMSISSMEQFTEEAQTWEKLDDHPHIVGVLDYDSEPFPWIALEYMDCGSLGERLENIGPVEALWTNHCVARAVRHAHRRGVAHLDLKPENVLLTSTGPSWWDTPKVADWGLAKMLLDHSQSVEGLSPHYAAPEQFDSDRFGPADDLTDVYAIGVLVYASLVGEPPFTGSSASVMKDIVSEPPTPPSEQVSKLPVGTDKVVLQALAKSKEDRYESVLDLRRDLETLVRRAFGDNSGELIAGGGTPTADQPSKYQSQASSSQAQSKVKTTGQGITSTANRSRPVEKSDPTDTQTDTDGSTFDELFGSNPESPIDKTNTGSAGTMPSSHSDGSSNIWILLLALGPIVGLLIGGSTHWIVFALGLAAGGYGMHRDMIEIEKLGGNWNPIENRLSYLLGMVFWLVTVPYYLYRRYRNYGI